MSNVLGVDILIFTEKVVKAFGFANLFVYIRIRMFFLSLVIQA